MRFLPSLETKAGSQADTVRRFSAASGGYVFGSNTPYQSSWSPERAVRDGYERVIWVYRCIDAIASAESRLPIRFLAGHPEDGKVVPPEREPLWKLLNRRANPYESASSFRYRLSSQLLLSKQGVFVEIKRNQAGEVIGLYLLPPHLTAPIPDPRRFLSGFQVTVPGTEPMILKPRDVLWIRRPHPLDPYMGATPMEPAGLSIDVDFYARLYNRNFLLNDGRPGGILAVKGGLDERDAVELQRRFSGGSQAGRTTVLEADSLDWVDTATTPRDSQYNQSMTHTKESILEAFGVPESQLGNASNRTFDNADAEEEIFWRLTMRAHNDLIDAAFDTLTQGGIDDENFVNHDTSSISVLLRDERQNEERHKALFDAGLETADEFAEATGRTPMNVPGTRVLWLSAGKIPIAANPKDQEEATKLLVNQAAEMGEITNAQNLEFQRMQAAQDSAQGTPESSWLDDNGSLVSANGTNGYKSHPAIKRGVMVAFRVNRKQAMELAIPGREQPDDMHVTLAYFSSDAAAEQDLLRGTLRECLETFSSVAPPVVAVVSGVGHFTVPEGTATYASVDSPELPNFHQRLMAALEAYGLEPRKDHGFTPHVTLAYTEPGATPPEVKPPTVTLLFDRVTLYWGADQEDFELRGERRQVRNLGHLRVG